MAGGYCGAMSSICFLMHDAMDLKNNLIKRFF
jgi:hypothetical protein